MYSSQILGTGRIHRRFSVVESAVPKMVEQTQSSNPWLTHEQVSWLTNCRQQVSWLTNCRQQVTWLTNCRQQVTWLTNCRHKYRGLQIAANKSELLRTFVSSRLCNFWASENVSTKLTRNRGFLSNQSDDSLQYNVWIYILYKLPYLYLYEKIYSILYNF